MFINILIISISLSIDAFGIGVSYKLKGVNIGTKAKLIIGLISSAIMWGSLILGDFINQILPNQVTRIIGSSILLIIGILFIKNSLFGSEEATFDRDRSLKIDNMEAIILGFALSADSISAGIAIATIGLGNFFIPIIVGMMQILLLYLGEFMVQKSKFLSNINDKICGVLSGTLLIFIAVFRGIK